MFSGITFFCCRGKSLPTAQKTAMRFAVVGSLAIMLFSFVASCVRVPCVFGTFGLHVLWSINYTRELAVSTEVLLRMRDFRDTTPCTPLASPPIILRSPMPLSL
jgi:hypothetical protein